MSVLQVANLWFNSTATARIDQVGSTVNIVSPSTNVSGNLVTTGAVSAANVSISGTNISTFMGIYKNKIINGNFDIWQRGTSNGMAGYFTADRWYNYNVGTTKTASRQSFTLGQTDVPGEPTYFMRHVVTSSAGASNSCTSAQYIESVRTLAGKTATLSFWAKADTSKNIAIEIGQAFGTGGSPSAYNPFSATTCALTSSWQKFIITVSVPSISGKTLGSNNNDSLAVLFWFDAGSSFNSRTNSLGQQSGTFDIAQVQLEEGPVATAFEQRHYGQEFSLCRRYYEQGVIEWDCPTTTGVTATAWFYFTDQKRAAPNILLINSYNANFSTSVGTTSAGSNKFAEQRTSNGTSTRGYWGSNFYADAEL